MKDILEQVLHLAQRAQAQASDVVALCSSDLSFEAFEGKLKERQNTFCRSLGVRVIKDGQVGVASTELLDSSSLERMVSSAVQSSHYLKKRPHEKIELAGGPWFPSCEGACPEDPTTMEEKEDLAISLESEVLKKCPGSKVPYNGLSCSLTEITYANSLGRLCQKSSRKFGALTSALLGEGQKKAFHSWDQRTRALGFFNPRAMADYCILHAQNFLKATPLPCGRYDVIFDLRTWESLLMAFGIVHSAKAAEEGLNPWRDQLGAKVMDERFTIEDDPTDPDGLAWSPFDGEGHPTAKLTLVEKGALKSFYHNTATANFFGTTSTGHARRGPGSHLGVGGTNYRILAGDTPEKELKSSPYLEVLDLDGLHSGAHPLSGDFSVGARGYFSGRPVMGITLSGNFFELLANNVQALGDRIHVSSKGAFSSPLVRFGGMSVSGT